MKLSPRLERLASMVDRNSTVVDIGSDHGLVPKWLIKHHHQGAIFATEFGDDTFQTLKRSLSDEPVSLYQADGLKHLPHHVTTVLISGMGGQLISSFLNDLPLYPQVKTLILGPQRDSFLVRHTLSKQGFKIIDECMIEDKQHYYPLIKAIKDASSIVLDGIEAFLGPVNMQHRLPSFLHYLTFLANDLKKKPQLDALQQTLLDWIESYVKD
jgi:tRNA (adenine22-N1)-methyltransferase